MIKDQTNSPESKGQMEMKYFLLGPEAQFFLTSNLALVQYLTNNSSTFDALFKKAERYLKRLLFVPAQLRVSEIKTHNQPDKFPFFNSKFFELILVLAGKEKTQEEVKFYVLSFDDDFIFGLHSFLEGYSEFIKSDKKVKDFLGTRLGPPRADDSLLDVETLNYKKHLENYKVKMRLIIQKMEIDRRETLEGIEIPPKEVLEDYDDKQEGQTEESGENKLVKLNNGSLYAGTLKGKRPEGNGKEFLEDGTSYVGAFKNGFWHGVGYLVDSENYICYGEFLNGRVVGI